MFDHKTNEKYTLCCQCIKWNVSKRRRKNTTEGLCSNTFGYPLTNWDDCCTRGTSINIPEKSKWGLFKNIICKKVR